MHRLRSLTILISTCMLLAMSCSSDDGTGPGGTSGPSGTISGQVLAPVATGYQPVAGAIVKVVGGPSAVADANGAFTMGGVAAGVDVVVQVAGPQSADPTHPIFHSSYQLVTSVEDGEVTQVFPYLVIGCSQIFDNTSGATVAMTRCGGGGEVTLTFETGDVVKLDGSAFNGDVRVDMAVLDPAADAHVAAFSQESESELDLGGVFGGLEVKLSEAETGNPLQVAAGHSVTVAVELADLTGINTGDLKVQGFDETQTAWVDQTAGVVTTVGPKSFYEYEATHFSGQRVIVGGGSGPRTCVSFCAQLPGSQTCVTSGFTTELYSNHRWFIKPAPTSCVDVAVAPIVLRLRYVAPWDGSVWEINGLGYNGIPPTLQCGSCLDLGQHDFEQYQVPGSGNPIADFTMNPTPAYVGEPVEFDATLSSDDDGIIVVDWDVDGDGNLERYGAIVQYTYDQTGTYDVRLRVIDSSSQVATRTKQLQVIDRNGGGDPRLTVTIEGEGSVISDPAGIACSVDGGDCAYEFPPSTFVTLTPTAYPGYTFEGFVGCNDQDPTACYVIMDSDRTVTAIFAAQ